jgi:hypothetical protein
MDPEEEARLEEVHEDIPHHADEWEWDPDTQSSNYVG